MTSTSSVLAVKSYLCGHSDPMYVILSEKVASAAIKLVNRMPKLYPRFHSNFWTEVKAESKIELSVNWRPYCGWYDLESFECEKRLPGSNFACLQSSNCEAMLSPEFWIRRWFSKIDLLVGCTFCNITSRTISISTFCVWGLNFTDGVVLKLSSFLL